LYEFLGAEPEPPIIRSETSLKIIQEPRLQRLALYWQALRNGRRLPAVSDVDPVDIPWALSRVFLLEAADVDGGWRVRLAGAEIERGFQRSSLKGVPIAELFEPETYPQVRNRVDACVRGPAVMYMHGRIYRAANRMPVGGRLQLPLADPVTGAVTGILGMSDWSRSTDDQAQDRLEVYAIPVDVLT